MSEKRYIQEANQLTSKIDGKDSQTSSEEEEPEHKVEEHISYYSADVRE